MNLRHFAICVAIILIALGSCSEVKSTIAHAKLNMTVEVPPIVGTGETFTCKIIFPKGYDVYYYNLIVFGYNLTNAGPVNTLNGSSNYTNIFFVNITSPDYGPQTIGIQIEGKARISNKWASTTKTVYVKVLKSLKFKVTIESTGNFDASNLTINFYIDGKYVGNVSVHALEKGKNTTVTFTWVPKDLKEGWHKLTAKIVGKGVVFSETKSTSYEIEFYYGKYEPLNIGPILFGILMLTSFMIVFLTLREIGKRRKPKWEK